jgi:hypothetical protein
MDEQRIVDEIGVLATRGVPREQLFAELAPRLRRVIDSDASCWHTLDPYTRLMTSDAPAELVERGIFTAEGAARAGELLVRSEYLVEDFNTSGGGRGAPSTSRGASRLAPSATPTHGLWRAWRARSGRRSAARCGSTRRGGVRTTKRLACWCSTRTTRSSW